MVNGEQSASAIEDQSTASPVIGVILLLAITVVLGGIGTFVLGLVDRANRLPTAQFAVEFSPGDDGYHDDDDWINVTHEGGDALDPDRVHIVVDGEDVEGVAGHWSDPVTAGDTLTITEATSPDHATVDRIDGADRVLVVWEHPQIDRTIVLAETAGPNATERRAGLS